MSAPLSFPNFKGLPDELQLHVILTAVGKEIYFSKSTIQNLRPWIEDIVNLMRVNQHVKALVEQVFAQTTIILEDEYAARWLVSRPNFFVTRLSTTVRIDMGVTDTASVIGLGRPHEEYWCTGLWDGTREGNPNLTPSVARPLNQSGPWCIPGVCIQPCAHQTLYHGYNVHVPLFRFVSMKTLEIASPRILDEVAQKLFNEDRNIIAGRIQLPMVPPNLVKILFLKRHKRREPLQASETMIIGNNPHPAHVITAGWNQNYPFDPIPIPLLSPLEIRTSALNHYVWIGGSWSPSDGP